MNQGLRREDQIEPIIVERMHPDGYMIINGHHRWAACAMMDMKCNVSIVNLTQKNDIINLIENSTHDKRVSLDLDEVVFCPSKEGYEKSLGFPHSMFFKQNIRTGIPALFHYLKIHGYDIWVYSSNYYSYDTISRLLRLYHADVDGVVTGTKMLNKREGSSNIRKAVAEKYKFTLNINDSSVIKIYSNSDDFEEREMNLEESTWAKEVMEIVKELDENE
nr:ParB/Srx family N-terminal domain-containing protein [Butyrivibrio sp. MC2021]